MTFSRSDLPIIKWSLITVSLSLVLGLSAIWVSNDYVTDALKSQQFEQKKLREARETLLSVQSDLANLASFSKEYESLQKRKVIGNEQRLDWVDDLKKLRTHNYVLDFKYTISPQIPYVPKPALDTGNFDVKLSNMSLQFDLLHEEQLLRFFSALRTDLNGWFIIDHCLIDRVASDSKDSVVALKAECVGGWLTMQNRNTK
jgi:hypothetical protein